MISSFLYRDLNDNNLQNVPFIKSEKIEALLLANNSLTSLPWFIGSLKSLEVL